MIINNSVVIQYTVVLFCSIISLFLTGFAGVGGVKLLGVPALPHKSSLKKGLMIAEATCKLLNERKCDEKWQEWFSTQPLLKLEV